MIKQKIVNQLRLQSTLASESALEHLKIGQNAEELVWPLRIAHNPRSRYECVSILSTQSYTLVTGAFAGHWCIRHPPMRISLAVRRTIRAGLISWQLILHGHCDIVLMLFLSLQ